MVSWQKYVLLLLTIAMFLNIFSVQTIAMFVGPWLYPKAVAFYRSIRDRPAAQIRPLPKATSYALAVLFVSAAIALISTFPFFAPENVFRTTQSRLRTEGSVLLRRLEALRPLTDDDHTLRAILDAGGMEARLLYARYGPRNLVDCPFTKPGNLGAGKDYFYYAVPSLLTPHMLHLFALGVATSGYYCGKEGAQWRSIAATAGVLLATVELSFLGYAYDDRKNLKSTRANEDDFIYWKLLVWRGVAIAALDGLLGWVIWLQATGRVFVAPRNTTDRILDHTMVMDRVLVKTKGLGIVRNGILRNEELRHVTDGYWVKEGEVMKSIFEEPEVVAAQRAALGRIDMVRVEREAEGFVQGILGGVQVVKQ